MNSNVFSVQWARDPNHKVDKWDKKNIQVFAEKLGEYHTNNNIKEALKLLIELDEYILTWEKTDSRNAICIYKTQENHEISCIIAEYGYRTSDSPEIIIQ